MGDGRRTKAKRMPAVISVFSYEWETSVECRTDMWPALRAYVESRRDLIDQFAMNPLGFNVTVFDDNGFVSRSRKYVRRSDGTWAWEYGYRTDCSRTWKAGKRA